jgi:tripartite-type tricarboxylate transporter receptor subunit TctC
MTHVPCKGSAGQMIPALMSNEGQFMFINLGNSPSRIRGGRINALATSSPTPSGTARCADGRGSGYPGMGANGMKETNEEIE